MAASGSASWPVCAPQSGGDEFVELHRLVSRHGVPTFTHIHTIGVEGSRKVIAAGKAYGAHVHLCHITGFRRKPIRTGRLRPRSERHFCLQMPSRGRAGIQRTSLSSTPRTGWSPPRTLPAFAACGWMPSWLSIISGRMLQRIAPYWRPLRIWWMHDRNRRARLAPCRRCH